MDEQTETLTEESQAGSSQLNDAAATKAEAVATDSLTLAEINELTGMSYKDKDSALKSIKDMKSQAGKAADLEGKLKTAMEATGDGSNPEVAELREKLNQVELDNFYSKNPDVNKALAETIAKANGISVQEAIATDLYTSTVAAPEKRTVATSNSRVANAGKEASFDPQGKSIDELAGFVTETYFKK